MKRDKDMENGKVQINYKLYFDAEDIGQTRILSSESYLKKSIAMHKNPYIAAGKAESDSNLDEFYLQLYVEGAIEEAECTDVDAAEGFLDEMAELLTEFARMQSYIEMEGDFSISFAGESIAYHFVSEAGDCNCSFTEK